MRVISGVCCCSEKLIDAIVKSDYLMQDKEKKMGQTSLFLPFLRHITQRQIDIISNNVSFKHRNIKGHVKLMQRGK